ncbi:mucin-5AC-like [Nilaparvata lugens]|uniref:mucin-5AC-like n=1 Tax=Nilaparvata lugens TaxID=108931 RepID=UPI00193E9366|nr:mucin-5AC-like [Nilaparvata lugens]
MKYIEALYILVALGSALARPQSEGRASRLEDDWRPMSNYHYVRPVYRPDPPLSRESKNQQIHNDTGSSNGTAQGAPNAESARHVPTTATPIGESLKMVTKQLLQSPTATDMVVTDVRTPPKIKTQQLKLEAELVSGKGEAVPVPLDEIHAYEIITNSPKSTESPKSSSMTPPTTQAGISTWVLLSGSASTTPTTVRKAPPKPTASIQAVSNPLGKKKTKPTTESSATTVVSDSAKSSSDSKLKPTNEHLKQTLNSTKKFQSNSSKEETVKTPITINLQDSRFRNKTPVTMGRVPTTSITKNKTEYVSSKKKVNATTPTPTATLEVKNDSSSHNETIQNRKKPVASLPASLDTPTTITIIPTAISSMKRVPVYHHDIPVVPTTSVIIETESADYDPDEITTEDLITTTKRPRRPANKKKRKPGNKTKKRPAIQNAETEPLKEDVLESKVTIDANATKSAIATHGSSPARPLSTRIYNYLAREVMPSVGVGIVGLVLTAGLAGLFLYPFGGGVVARRNAYEPAKNPLASPDSHMYYYNEYSPKNEPDNGQAEETVFGQVLSGMSQSESQYSDSISKNSANTYNHNMNANSNVSPGSKYRYDPGPSSAGAPTIVYPTKDSKYTSTGSADISSIDRNRDSSGAYSTLTDIDSAHNDRNYPSLTTDNPDLSQFSGSQYSNLVGSSSATQFTSSGSSGSSGIYVGSIMNPDTNFTYSEMVGSSSMKASDTNQHYSSMVSSPTVLTASDSSNTIPQYSSLIASPTTSNTENDGAQYLSRFASSSSSSNSRPQYSSLISSSASPQYSSVVDSSGNGHYSPSMKDSSSGSHYSTNMKDSSSSHFSPQISDSSNSKYSQLTGISIETSNGKYSSSHSPTHSSKYQASEYTAYSNPSDIGTPGGMYTVGSSSSSSERENHRPPSVRYSDWEGSSEQKDVPSKEEDKSDKSQPQFAAVHSSQFSAPSRTETAYPSGIDMISITGPNYSVGSSSESRRSNIGVEHGPRNMKIRRRRQIPSHNEIDGDLPKDEPEFISTTTKYMENNQESTTQSGASTNSPTTTETDTTTFVSADRNETLNETVVESEKNVQNIDDDDSELTTSKPQEDGSFLSVIRRIAQFKFKLGLTLLRSTSMAVSRYFQSVQRRMEKVIRRLEKRAKEAEQQRKSKNEKSIERRTKREAKSHRKSKKTYKKKNIKT